MRKITWIILLLTTFNAFAENYSGVWQDESGQIYSIHHKHDSILMAKLIKTKHKSDPYQQGNLFITNNALDLAINGSGFFALVDKDGSYYYTRDGSFGINKNGYIVDSENRKLLTVINEPLPNNVREISISEDGIINLTTDDHWQSKFYDQLILAWIPSDVMRFSGYPISSIENDKVSFFKPHEPANNHFGASIMQYATEGLNYEERSWRAYEGVMDNNLATFTQIDDQNISRTFKLVFEMPDHARVDYENEFLLGPISTTQKENAQTSNQLLQLYTFPQERVNGPLTKIF